MPKQEKKIADQPVTYVIDASNRVLGRLATRIAILLMGKNKASWHPASKRGGIVLIRHADRIKITGKKLKQKIYYHHSGHPQGLKEKKMRDVFAARPGEVIRRAVYRMLPKNKLRTLRINRLKFK